MVESIKENGWTTTWRDLVFTLGKTAVNIADNIMMTKSMASVYTHGQIKEFIQECGCVGSSMVSAFTQFPDRKVSMVFGKMARESNGSTLIKYIR